MFNLTNISEHPSRPGHTIFHFHKKERAEFFEFLLKESTVQYETTTEEYNNKTVYYFGLKNRDLKIARQKNYLVSAKYRKPIIPNVYFRWSVIAFAIFVMSLALIGYIKQG